MPRAKWSLKMYIMVTGQSRSQIFSQNIAAHDYLLGNVFRFTVMTATSEPKTRSAEERVEPAPPPSEILKIFIKCAI